MNYVFTDILLILLLLLSVYYDMTQRKIPNRITMPAILIGFIWSAVNSGLDGFLFSLFGFLIGFAVFLLPYISGGIGAGDVKLMAAIGTLMGWSFALVSALATAIAGGLVVFMYLIINGGFKRVFINAFGVIIKPLFRFIYMVTGNKWFLEKQKYFFTKKSEKENEYIPYAIAIAAGTISVLIFNLDALIQF